MGIHSAEVMVQNDERTRKRDGATGTIDELLRFYINVRQRVIDAKAINSLMNINPSVSLKS